MFEEIGSVRSEADAEALGLLALFRDSISEIRLNEPESASTYFKPDYSHYIVVHTPLSIRYPEKREEWNLRFSRDVGVSLVELVRADESSAYVKGLMGANGSKVYAILPYTSIDAGKAKLAKFPEDRMGKVRAGKRSWTSAAVSAASRWKSQGTTPTRRSMVLISTTP